MNIFRTKIAMPVALALTIGVNGAFIYADTAELFSDPTSEFDHRPVRYYMNTASSTAAANMVMPNMTFGGVYEITKRPEQTIHELIEPARTFESIDISLVEKGTNST